MSTQHDLEFLRTISELTYCNPFLPERLVLERRALGETYVAEGKQAWSRELGLGNDDRPNVQQITQRATQLFEQLLEHPPAELQETLLLDLQTYVLYYRYFMQHQLVSASPELLDREMLSQLWQRFWNDYQKGIKTLCRTNPSITKAAHLFACLFQVRRAFYHIYDCILGDSRAIIQLRAMVWQSVFTHNMRRYQETLFHRLNEIPTLITGPSGTGKDLVARSIGMSQFIPFDHRSRTFVTKGELFIPLNLSALSPTLIESELFGHKKGSFTGATSDNAGYLELCSPHGVVFLDEIGELEQTIQVKLLRVLQNRTWARLGETTPRSFQGKIIAATNRNLQNEIEQGHFRLDLFYRLCADRIVTPSLADQLADSPDALQSLIGLLALRIAGDAAAEVAQETMQWIEQKLPRQYSWPGNVRELEQCVRNILIRSEYQPSIVQSKENLNACDQWLEQIRARQLTIEELHRSYATWVYAEVNSYEGTAQQLGIDRRTVKSWLDQEFLSRLMDHAGTEAYSENY
ncbi:MAG: sigma-54-dependent Fis family transcriptional regulator [Planctomycetaceae bacterium]|nr:sigma-54-dependent Fis family transcriptional regulator [Planctomycetaceae bacterium]